MVKSRQRRTNRGRVTKEILEKAVNLVKAENLSLRKAATLFNVCHVSLYRYKNQLDKNNVSPKMGYRPHNKVFSEDMEKDLVNYCQTATKLYLGVLTKDFCELALKCPKLNKLKYLDGWNEAGMASKDWLIAFLKRNPSFSIQIPESTNLPLIIFN